jgi:hypothetical protein
MLSTKIRTIIVTIVVAGSLSFAIGPLASVAGAAKNNGGYQQEQKAKLCRQVGTDYNNYENAAEGAEKNGETKQAAEYHEIATKLYNYGAGHGCWPAVRQTPPPPSGPPVTAHP